jgi:hypothetical protein
MKRLSTERLRISEGLRQAREAWLKANVRPEPKAKPSSKKKAAPPSIEMTAELQAILDAQGVTLEQLLKAK